MKILEENVLTRAVLDEIDGEIETDATATARDVVITVAKFDATPQPPMEQPDERDPDQAREPGDGQDAPQPPQEPDPDQVSGD